MKTSQFFHKLLSRYLWGNLLAQGLTVAVMLALLLFAVDAYTRHGVEVKVPDLREKAVEDATHILKGMELSLCVRDTGYVKTLPEGCVLEQDVAAGRSVKPGRTIYVMINSSHCPALTLPDLIENSSFREAKAKLLVMGFKVGVEEYTDGEKDWLYGIKARGRSLHAGERIPLESTLTLVIGSGTLDDGDNIIEEEVEPDKLPQDTILESADSRYEEDAQHDVLVR